ncbi:hypothetical protein ABIF79_010035 [Bradyrhizobium japonicum]
MDRPEFEKLAASLVDPEGALPALRKVASAVNTPPKQARLGTRASRPRLSRMTGRVLYESTNGDVWRLVRHPHSGRPAVEHQPNASSGRRASLT